MIEQINNEIQINNYSVTDIYSVRILSLLKAYGCKYPFARFYQQINDQGELVAIISSLDNNITVSFTNKSDKKEIAEFVSLLGYSSLLCDDSFNINGFYEFGFVMKSVKKVELNFQEGLIDEYPPLFDLYNFIDYGESNFEAWYVDINHRIRHECAKAVTLNINDEIVSSAIFSSIYNNYAIITGVQTKSEYRKMGYGSSLVSAMCSDFNGTVFLMREENRNESFYKRLGFENTGKWRLYK